MKTWIVIPCFNEERRLQPDRFRAYARTHPDVGVVFVDDGSTDGTRPLLDRLAGECPGRLLVEALPVNRGKGEAVRAGLRRAVEAGAAHAGYWDADLSTSLEMAGRFAALLEERPALEAVLGSRLLGLGRRIERRAVRHLLGRLFATAVGTLTRLPVYDSQCGAKLFRVGAPLRRALERPFRSRWAFDVELLLRLLAAAGPAADPHHVFWEEPLPAWRDVPGSKMSWFQGVKALWDVWQLRAR